jgi:hypothetical protein
MSQYIRLLPKHFEDMESNLDSLSCDLINQLDIAYKKSGKDVSCDLTNKFLEFQYLLREQIKDLFPNNNFKNF